jgi:hypothetical protein
LGQRLEQAGIQAQPGDDAEPVSDRANPLFSVGYVW